MNPITYDNCTIHFVNQDFTELNSFIASKNYSKIFLLVDENTHINCLPLFAAHLRYAFDIIEVEAGEENKTIETCLGVWQTLSDLGADRKSLILNLGGGVITDLGGFVANTFRRGIDFVNIPTSLLAMVDASIGGKTGVDLGLLKNQIGVINNPELIFIDTLFLKTLPLEELKSGFAEMLKHGLIADEEYWHKLVSIEEIETSNLDELIHESIRIKKSIVEQDINEDGIRKALNYGHTIGHAIETYSLSNNEIKPLLHGEAVAIGMIVETYISSQIKGFDLSLCNEVKNVIKPIYPKVEIPKSSFDNIIAYTNFDKKNSHGNVNFVLLEKIGHPKFDCKVDQKLIIEGFNFYNS